MQMGIGQARQMGTVLERDYGIDVSETPVAVSELRRSQETAFFAGFKRLVVYTSLNEIDHGLNLPDLRAMLDAGQLPAMANEGAAAILEDPPVEPVWITHGLVIAGLCAVTGIDQGSRLIPRFCEIRELPLTPQAS